MSNINEEINKEVTRGEVGAYSFVDKKLKELKDSYGSEVPNAESKEGYERSKMIAKEMRTLRISLEAKRKEIKAPALQYGKMIDAEAKRLTAEIENIEQPHALAYKEVDDVKKQLKLDAEQRLIDIKKTVNNCHEMTPEQIESVIDEVANTSIDYETFRHKLDDAKGVVPSILSQLSQEHAKAIEREVEAQRIESERLELEALRAEKARKEQEDYERQQAEIQKQREAEIAEQAAKQAEAEKRQAIEREKAAVIAKEQAEKQAVIDAENARIQAQKDAEFAAEQAVKAEQERKQREIEAEQAAKEKREADIAYIGGIRKEAKEAIMALGIDEEKAKEIVLAIHNNQIPNVNINY